MKVFSQRSLIDLLKACPVPAGHRRVFPTVPQLLILVHLPAYSDELQVSLEMSAEHVHHSVRALRLRGLVKPRGAGQKHAKLPLIELAPSGQALIELLKPTAN